MDTRSVTLVLPERLYQSVVHSARERDASVSEYLSDVVRAHQEPTREELAAEGYRALATETRSFADSALATATATWPEWPADAPNPQRRPVAHRGTCRADILAAAREVMRRSGVSDFTMKDIIAEMRRVGSPYAESSVRTHIGSVMCRNAPKNHGTVYNDLERVGHGRYRLASTDEEAVA